MKVEATIEGPQDQPSDPEPSWLNDEPIISETSVHASEPSDGSSLADIVADTVDMVHHKVAVSTGYAAFELDEKELALWRRVLRFLLKSLPLGKWPEAIACMSLIMAEGTKIYGLMVYMKESGKWGHGTDVAPPKPERVNQEMIRHETVAAEPYDDHREKDTPGFTRRPQ